MALSKEEQKTYDAAIEEFRSATRAVLRAGSDDFDATSTDLTGLLDDLLDEALEDSQ